MVLKKKELYVGEKRFNFKKVIITGMYRSGKSLLGKILGTLENVEFVDEPWLPTVLPHFQGNNLLDPRVAKDIMRSYLEEMLNDMILLRQTNFRPRDQSTIWARKDEKEIIYRLLNLHTRDDVRRYVKEKNPVLLLNLSFTTPHVIFLAETFPGCKIIHVIRNGLDVALDVEEKKWYSNRQLKQPVCSGDLYRIYCSKIYFEKYYIPWWVKRGDEEKFLGMNDFAKGLYLWRRHFELAEKEINKFKSSFPNQYKEVRFESILKKPEAVINDLSEFFNVKLSKQTELVLSEIDAKMLKSKKRYPLNEIPSDEKKKVKRLLTKLKYSTFNLL